MDWHDVDEDKMAICNIGGVWNRGNDVGIACRELYAISAFAIDSVASSTVEILILYGFS